MLHSLANFLQTSFFKKSQLGVYLGASHVALNNGSDNLFKTTGSQIAQQNNEAIPIWQQSCTRLESLLEATKNKSNSPITILIGSDLVRFLVLPPQQVMMKIQEKVAYATAAFQEIYGASAINWEIKHHDNAPNQPTVAAAIDKNLLNTISQHVQNKQFRLVSVQPYVMTAFNESAKYFTKANTYLAIVEMSRLTLIFIESGRYQQLRSHVIGDDLQADLKKILLREIAVSDKGCRHVLVCSARHQAIPFTIEGWTVKQIDQLKTHSTVGNFRLLKAAT